MGTSIEKSGGILERFNLKGRVALVTGGSKGLGKAMARGLAQAGADIVIVSRNREELESSLADIRTDLDVHGKCVVGDLSRREDVARIATEALALAGHVDILINNAGSNIPENIDAVTDAAFDSIVELNLRSVMALTRAIVPSMKKLGWGRIINISSIMAFAPLGARSAYAATKAGVVAMAKNWAVELGSFGITANTIAPGPFLTDLTARLLTETQKNSFSAHTALGRWGNPEELVAPALLLASDAGSYITGECLFVDGGYMVK